VFDELVAMPFLAKCYERSPRTASRLQAAAKSEGRRSGPKHARCFAMSRVAAKRMTVDEFIPWTEAREGKWELHDGQAVAMAPGRARHSLVKAYAISALVGPVRRANAPCRVYADGLAIRVSKHRAFRPDAVVVCPAAQPEEQATSMPLVAVEVLSPTTAAIDLGLKRDSYFSLSSLALYLILDPDRRTLTDHARAASGDAEPRIFREGALRLDAPGIDLEVADMLGPPD
jgi:Uma2 family endonuclease